MQQSLNIRKFTGFAFIELALWGDANLRTDNPAMRKSKELKAMKADKAQFVAGLIGAYKKQLLAFDKLSIRI